LKKVRQGGGAGFGFGSGRRLDATGLPPVMEGMDLDGSPARAIVRRLLGAIEPWAAPSRHSR
jgi:hypothetical protein